MDRFVVISGCSGGGKSTLIGALAEQGYATVAEPGRRIVAEESAGDGTALPWVDPEAFARRAVAMALTDRVAATAMPGRIFFDRGLIDAVVALDQATGGGETERLGRMHRYHGRVFLVPPWPEIFGNDGERRHDFAAAEAEYARLTRAYPALGYEVVVLPKVDVAARVECVIGALGDVKSSLA